MANSKHTKRALLASILSVVLCAAMLVGSTFAWFTDSVTSGNNKIVAGNLDVELEYRNQEGKWNPVTETTKLFQEDALWEPGHTEVVYLRVKNAGTLALKYQLAVTAANETTFTNALGKEGCRLSDYLVFGQVESDTEIVEYATREEAWAAAGDTLGLSDYTKESELYPEEIDGKPSEQYIALVVYMPTEVGNEANYRGDAVPSIDLGVNLVATQYTYETDSFGNDYDADAVLPGGWQKVDSADDISGDGKYILSTDITETVTLNPENNAVIDLNGKNLTNGLTVNGNVTIMDNSTGEEKGTTNGISARKDAVLTIESGTHTKISSSSATVVINGGTITGQNTAGHSHWIINDGHFSSTGTLFNTTQGETIEINGGTFDGIMNFGNKANPATVTINGGTFNSDVSATYGTWNINDGIFNGPVYASVSKGYEYATCHISGGTFNHTGNKCGHENSHYMFYGNSSNPQNYYQGYTITGGSFKTDPTNYMNNNSGTVTESDGYFIVSK